MCSSNANSRLRFCSTGEFVPFGDYYLAASVLVSACNSAHSVHCRTTAYCQVLYVASLCTGVTHGTHAQHARRTGGRWGTRSAVFHIPCRCTCGHSPGSHSPRIPPYRFCTYPLHTVHLLHETVQMLWLQ